jgi:hypothetical protein
MPNTRIHQEGFKSPPVAAFCGRGPPDGEKKTFFDAGADC